MIKSLKFNRLSIRLTLAFLIAATSGVALIALLAYRLTSQDFMAFYSHMQSMERMMSGMMGRGMMGGMNLALAQREFLDNLSRTLWIGGISGVALAFLLGAIFTRQIVSPLGKISRAAHLISRGDLKQRVEVKGPEEISELASSFNAMAASLNRDREWRHQMLADIAHELRTPLFILQGNTEAMLEGILPTDRQNLASLHQETLLLSRLVEDLRTLSLAEVGQLSFQPSSVDLKELCLKIMDGFKGQAAAQNIRLSLETKEGQAHISAWADRGRLEQVIRNLLANAFQYTPEGGHITIKIASNREGITLSVMDSGIGIPPEDLPRVFDRFYRVDRSRGRSTGGSGLGLAIVKQLIEGQGGKAGAESTPGKGSAFFFTIPAVPLDE